MLSTLKKKIFGTHSDRKLKQYTQNTPHINEYDSSFSDYDDKKCHVKTEEFKKRILKGESLDQILPEAFALVRRASMETIGQRHFDVQLIGGMALHDGQIAEMKTGEGKTLTSTLPAYLNALTGKGVHVVTVNDYLAKRDSEWMGEVFGYLGLTVGLIQHGQNDEERRTAYKADITYGTNNEFGFDYLRDNMKYSLKEYVQREHAFAIIDEVDSILIDEARTPLIISGPSEISTDKYTIINQKIPGLSRGFRVGDNPDIQKASEELKISPEEYKNHIREWKDYQIVIQGDYVLDDKNKNIHLTEKGVEKMEQRLSEHIKRGNLYDVENMEYLHHINQAIKAHYVFKKNVDYVVQNGEVKIVDEFTGRIMEGRRFSDGLHQALEAKENVTVEKENQTLASITFQNYFRRYNKLSGMTGTARTEETEFNKIYNLGVVSIPTNKKMVRIDQPDVIYKTKRIKLNAIIDKIAELNKKLQPVLVGTDSIASSEELSSLLKSKKIKHSVLNAKYHEKEAEIVANAGQVGSVTIATNMAGRGTDIQLEAEAHTKGGLFILGTLRHESRRVDNQLRGRSGRQGDPGESRFFLSLEDDLLKNFGGERISGLMDKLNIQEDEAIEHVLISRAIENSQKKVEAHNFSIRKHLLEYDDVMNRQREAVYQRRQEIIDETKNDALLDMGHDVIDELLNTHCDENRIDEWDLDSLRQGVNFHFNVTLPEFDESTKQEAEGLETLSHQTMKQRYQEKVIEFGQHKKFIEKQILISISDTLWKEHLLQMDYLKENVGLRGFAQKNPLDEYKKEAFQMFEQLISTINREAVKAFFHAQLVEEPSIQEPIPKNDSQLEFIHGEVETVEKKTQAPIKKKVKIGRNEPCPCGNGKKFKNCSCEWKKTYLEQTKDMDTAI